MTRADMIEILGLEIHVVPVQPGPLRLAAQFVIVAPNEADKSSGRIFYRELTAQKPRKRWCVSVAHGTSTIDLGQEAITTQISEFAFRYVTLCERYRTENGEPLYVGGLVTSAFRIEATRPEMAELLSEGRHGTRYRRQVSMPRNIQLRFDRGRTTLLGSRAAHYPLSKSASDARVTSTAVWEPQYPIQTMTEATNDWFLAGERSSYAPIVVKARVSDPASKTKRPAAATPAHTEAPSAKGYKPGDKIMLPQISSTAYYLVRSLRTTTDVDFMLHSRTSNIPVFLRGLPGTGKTMLVEAAYQDIYTVMGTLDTEVADFIGTYVQRPDGTYLWTDGPLLRAMEEGKPLFIDEIGLVDPRVMAVVYSVMDGRRSIVVTSNPERGTVTASDGFYVCAASNPDAPGVRISEALLSRFGLALDVHTDYALAKKLGVNAEVVAAAKNLETRRLSSEVSWSPQFRELINYKEVETVFGTDFALAALVASAPETDRPLVQDVLSRTTGKQINVLELR